MTTLRAAPGSRIRALLHLLRLARVAGLRRTASAVAAWGAAAPVAIAAHAHPDAVALVRGEVAVTAGELARRAELRAAELAEQHVRGTRIGVEVDGGIGGLVELFAAVRAGLDAVPLGPRLSPADADTLRDPVAPARARRRGPGRLLPLTTGTTGAPHPTGGALRPGTVLQLADLDHRIALPAGPVLLLAPPDHGHGLSMLLACLLHGETGVLGAGLPPERRSAMFAARPATVTGVPAQLARLTAPQLDGVELVVSGSSRLDPGLAARLRAGGARVLDCYGTSETGTVAVDGVLVAGCRIRVAGDGTLRLGSPARRGFSPGDRGAVIGGRLHGVARADARADSGGETVDPARLLASLTAMPEVREARVTIAPHELLGSVLHAEVELRAGAELAEAAVRARLGETLSRAEHPRVLRIR